MLFLSIPCGPSMMDYPETSGNLCGRFPAGYRIFLLMKFLFILITNLETCRKPPRPVFGGFRRFPDNPSLTDYTVYVNLSKITFGTGVFFLLVFTTVLKWGALGVSTGVKVVYYSLRSFWWVVAFNKSYKIEI